MDKDKPVLPKDSTQKKRMPMLYIVIGVAAAIAIILTSMFIFYAHMPQYSLSVEPRSEMVMGTGMMVRVYLTNTGSQALTNINLNWGSTSESLPILNSGEKVMFSPPSSAKMVTVTADHGINIMKPLMDSMK